MRTLVVVILLIVAIGGSTSAIDAANAGERLFELACVGAALCGLAVLAYLRYRAIGSTQFRRELGMKDIAWGELLAAAWWLVAAPAFAYSTIEHTLRIETPNQRGLAVFLGTLGAVIYAVRQARRLG